MIKCSECGKDLDILEEYRHPVEGRKKIVCSTCWNKIDDSESRYTNFILDHVNKTSMGPICFVLIKVAPSFEKESYNKLINLPEIIEIYPLIGMYDFIVKIKAKNSNELGNYIINNIRRVNGITSTNTLTGAFSLTGIKY
jgi:DNA-binding Lrp family transcriptional regulator